MPNLDRFSHPLDREYRHIEIDEPECEICGHSILEGYICSECQEYLDEVEEDA